MTWISVEDRLPKENEEVLCIDADKRQFTAIYERLITYCAPGYRDKWDHGFCCGGEPGEPTHWMPLPVAPKE